MSRRLNVALVLFVLAPVVLMSWLGLRSVRLERAQLQAQYEATAMRLLVQYDNALMDVVDRIQRELLSRIEHPIGGADAQRTLVRGSRFVRQPFLFDPDKGLLVPDPVSDVLNQREKHFLERTAAWRRAGNVFARNEADEMSKGSSASGWYTWFWEDGLHFVFWKRLPNGNIQGVELDRYALLAEVIAALPHEVPKQTRGRYTSKQDFSEYVALRGPSGDVLYAWGEEEFGKDAAPWAIRSLSGPLAAWQLSYYGGSLPAAGITPAAIGLLMVIFAVVVVMLLAFIVIVREHNRAMRDARQRVSFVNQVSHELKTPLTNIRMYSELLEQRVADQDPKAGKYTSIVLSESRRLARMIHNVLSFGKQGRGALTLHRSEGSIDGTVSEVLEHFRPAFARKNMEVVFKPDCPGNVSFDRDAIEQILGNVLGNAEKYAGEGSRVDVETGREGECAFIVVKDNGPGIPQRYREQIFKPFFRLDERLIQQASGAGIGLSISRDLARLHGGDLVLVPDGDGACFRLTLALKQKAVPMEFEAV